MASTTPTRFGAAARRRSFIPTVAAVPVVGAAAGVAHAGGTELWSFDLSTSGENVSYTSPTSVRTDAAAYRWTSTIELIEVTVSFSVITVTLDVTDEIPPEFLATCGLLPGPLPVSIQNQTIVFPEPPEDPALEATLSVGIDAVGTGFVDVTDITLGTATVDLGFPFGVQTVNIEGFRVMGAVTVDPTDAGDVDGNGVVGFDDVLAVLAAWGTCECCPADLDGDFLVGFNDLLQVLSNWDG